MKKIILIPMVLLIVTLATAVTLNMNLNLSTETTERLLTVGEGIGTIEKVSTWFVYLFKKR